MAKILSDLLAQNMLRHTDKASISELQNTHTTAGGNRRRKPEPCLVDESSGHEEAVLVVAKRAVHEHGTQGVCHGDGRWHYGRRYVLPELHAAGVPMRLMSRRLL